MSLLSVKHPGLSTKLLLAMLELAFAWGIGASRFRDNRHHPSDIVGE